MGCHRVLKQLPSAIIFRASVSALEGKQRSVRNKMPKCLKILPKKLDFAFLRLYLCTCQSNAARSTAVPKKMLIKLLIICFSVSYEDISMRRILKWMYCANFAQTFKMSQYVPNSLRVQSVVPIHR